MLLQIIIKCGSVFILASLTRSNGQEPPVTAENTQKRTDGGQCMTTSCGCMVGPGGPPGVPGVPGINGWPGSAGQKGSKGDKGQQGVSGFPGEIGMPGPVGPEGIRGRRGFPGEPGAAGEAGRLGSKGERGFPGLPGLKGQRGDSAAAASTQVAFSVLRSQRLGPVAHNTIVTFDTIFTNIGNHFDEQSSQFICKVNGTFVFMAHILGQENQDAHAYIMVNQRHKIPIHADNRAGYGTGSQTVILQLTTHDNVWIQLGKGSGLMNDYTTFSGYLLYPDSSTTRVQNEISNYLQTNRINDDLNYWQTWKK